MISYKIPYGDGHLSFRFPNRFKPVFIKPRDVPGVSEPQEVVRKALENPVGGVSLSDFRGARSVAIAINDKTRPVPNHHLLPPLLRYLVRCHHCDDRASLLDKGITSRDTPVWINRHFAEADLRIVVGLIEPHQFQGFSGGVKGAAIGLAGRDTINHNHAMMTSPKSRLGGYLDNPARQDVEEIGQLVGVHFSLNALLNSKGQIVSVLAGDPAAVMERGIPLSREISQVQVDKRFDLIIASPGGYPKDINLYQSQKALAHASMITRTGGTVILTAACTEGTGSHTYEMWINGVSSHQEVIERFRRESFQVGPHKAVQIALDAMRVNILLMSELEPRFVRKLLLTPISSLDEALEIALVDLPVDANIGIMSQASSTIPFVRSK
jgi:nickel-dependent lactate racemase